MFGKYRHSVDPKGRLFVPAKLREELGDAFYVTLGLDHCVSVYTEAAWQRCMEKYNNLSMSQSRAMRLLLANAAKCEPDKQGRFLIPTELRDYANIRQNVWSHRPGKSRRDLGDLKHTEAMEAEMLTPENLAAAMETGIDRVCASVRPARREHRRACNRPDGIYLDGTLGGAGHSRSTPTAEQRGA